ncbi:MAG: enoyl-CoA hydratase/isomerase family protein [Candidatus Tectomicrobia bacterium]|uniref:Enoyl-CoA hydratase/isomerase family protein n=1 Tax=Tectimicrobiota bacterium TaxID=2528274 RepID=A0A933GPJ8_UNCTE|nr:enoyl-CoA hydratase/isomerase family protein [Candidatus Tectomicrobia bacterium]
MTFENIILEKKNGIAKIILNRPHALNAVTEGLLEDLVAALEDIEKDDSVKVVILKGAGKAFSAGRDLKGVMEGKKNREGPDTRF